MRQVHRIWYQIGRRGVTLLFLFMLDEIYALSLANPPAEAVRSSTFHYIVGLAPLPVWAAAWAAVGVVCLIGAFQRRDRWAFTAAVALKALWGSIFLFGWLIQGLDRGWVNAVVWLAFGGLVYMFSTWPETFEVHDAE